MNNKINNVPAKTLAFFDFDGTVTKEDSFIDFLFFSIKIPRLIRGLFFIIPILIAYGLKMLSNEKAKQKVLSFYFKGMSKEEFYKIGKNYSTERIPAIIKTDAIRRIEWHKQQGHQVVIVSASLKTWLNSWCKNQGVGLISTKMEVVDGYLTGLFNGRNCFGPEKVRQIRKQFIPENYYIYAYGDSRGDREMLELADKKFYRFFKR